MPSAPLTPGGGSGGYKRPRVGETDCLTRAELRAMERAIRTERFPLDDEDREGAAREVSRLVREGRYERTRLSAARVMVAMDRSNLSAEIAAARLEQPNTSLNVNVNLSYEELCKLPHDELIRLHRASLSAPALPDATADGAPMGQGARQG